MVTARAKQKKSNTSDPTFIYVQRLIDQSVKRFCEDNPIQAMLNSREEVRDMILTVALHNEFKARGWCI